MSYSLIIKNYNKEPEQSDVPVLQRDSFQELIILAYGASMLANSVWTRHSSWSTSIQHMDTYHDHFNEGCIILVPSDQAKDYK